MGPSNGDSLAGAHRKRERRGQRLIARYDVSVAFFHALSSGGIAVIPPKDLFDGEWAWELVKAMNGTREASRQWSLYIRSAMVPEGFRLSELVPNLFHHDEWDITMACHGDDFIAEGTAADLDRLDGIMKRHFQVKVLPRIGDPSYGGAVAEGNHLNRIIQWSDKGFSWQADPKHAVEFVKELGLEGSKGVETPASKDTGRNERHADDPLSSSDASEFRRLAGIALYLSLDRPSIPFPVLQIAAGMSKPTLMHWLMLKRLGRYLISFPVEEWLFVYQEERVLYLL